MATPPNQHSCLVEGCDFKGTLDQLALHHATRHTGVDPVGAGYGGPFAARIRQLIKRRGLGKNGPQQEITRGYEEVDGQRLGFYQVGDEDKIHYRVGDDADREKARKAAEELANKG